MRTAVVVASLWIAGCGNDIDRGYGELLPAPRPEDGIQIAYSIEVPPGEEVWKCNVSDLPNERFLSVNHVESVQNDSMHHMDLMAIALAAPHLPPGEYDCDDLYAQYPTLMDNGITLYASQRAEQEVILPPGVVAELLPKLRVMHEIHYVNPTDAPVTAFSTVNAYKYRDEDVTATIWGGANRDLEIAIPPGATDHVEWTRCTFNKDVEVLFLSTHTHALADRAEIRTFDGTNAGAVIYSNTDWHAPPLQDYTAAPMRVPAGHGFEYACHYRNPSATEVRWGFSAAEEMCQIAVVFTPGEATRTCTTVTSGVRAPL